ncbi:MULTISPECIES: hypothetical protein [Legionella]|uniref:hypothetical protein n=1 Tax=Legionella sp. TaxID=459 RepID=UPI0012E34A73|nr:hypothetical protein [Legionella maceachernii]
MAPTREQAYMVFKRCDNAKHHWHKLRGFKKFAVVIRGVKFVNGLRDTDNSVDEVHAA